MRTARAMRLAVALVLLAMASVGIGASRRKPKPLVGVPVGPTRDDVVAKQFLVDPPTVHNLGFRWYVEGDSNRNATVNVTFRKKGEQTWRPALPMLRVHHEIANQDYGPYRCGNLFAGSVLFLDPATEYEVRFEMKDPDGGAPPVRVVSASTRGEPGRLQGDRQVRVYPRGYKGPLPAGALVGLAAAVKQAKPGDVLLLAGVYRGPFTLAASGTPDKPIVLRPGGSAGVVLEAGDLKTDLLYVANTEHLALEGLKLRNARFAIRAGKKGGPGAKGLIVRRCRVENVISGIWTTSENAEGWFIADNVLTGTNPTWYPRPRKTYMSPSHTGINVYGQGHVVCYNRVSRFSDAVAVANYGPPHEDVRKHCVSIDFYNNDLSWAQDDTFEADYGCHNIRCYRNRCFNAHTALSVQPSYGGPIYLIRNEAYSITGLALKLHNWCTGLEIYNNTLLVAGQGFRSYYRWQNAALRNNLLLGGKRYAMETGSPSPTTTLDYNGYRKTDDPLRFLKWHDGKKWGKYLTLEAFRKATGHEAHGLRVDYDIFVRAARPAEGTTYQPADVDLRLNPNAKAVDAGCVLPTVTDGYAGKAPDMGCHEVGAPLPHYGPRW